MRVKPKRPTKSIRTTTKLKRREGKILGKKSRAELMGVKNVEVVQKTNGKMLAMVMRQLSNDIQDAMKDNHKTEEEIMRTIGVRRYEK